MAKKILVAGIFVFSLCFCNVGFCQQIEPISPVYFDGTVGRPIPNTKYAYYTFLLVPNEILYQKYSDAEWKKIQHAYQILGEKLQKKALCVSFLPRNLKASHSKSAEIIQKLNARAKTPFGSADKNGMIVFAISNYYPEDAPQKGHFFTAAAWNNAPAGAIIDLIGRIEIWVDNNDVRSWTLEQDKGLTEVYNFIKENGGLLALGALFKG